MTFYSEGCASGGPGHPLFFGGDASVSAPWPPPFAVSAEFLADGVTLGVRGEVDILTAPDLGAILDGVTGRGYRVVVVDLARTTFMDAAGLRRIADAARHVALLGGQLTLRSPSAIIRRILDITGLTAAIRIEDPVPARSDLGPEQPVDPSAAPSTTDDLARELRMVTTLPVTTDLVDGALRLVVALARATVGGADGVSVSLRRHGQLATVAASDQTISDMDASQYATGEGPCVAASVEGRWFHVEALDTETRWPAFTPRAQALGINAILSSPLRSGEDTVGALNIYSRTATAFAPADQQLAALFADQASTILTDVTRVLTDEQMDHRVDDALRSRQVIAQAQGVIMQRDGLGPDAAYTTLRCAALNSGKSLRDQAGDVVAAVRHRSPTATTPTPGGARG